MSFITSNNIITQTVLKQYTRKIQQHNKKREHKQCNNRPNNTKTKNNQCAALSSESSEEQGAWPGSSHPCTGSCSSLKMLEVKVDRARSSRSAPISVTTTHWLISNFWGTEPSEPVPPVTVRPGRHRCVCDVTFLSGGVQRFPVQERPPSSLSVEQLVLHAAVHNPKLRLTATDTQTDTCQSTSRGPAPALSPTGEPTCLLTAKAMEMATKGNLSQ